MIRIDIKDYSAGADTGVACHAFLIAQNRRIPMFSWPYGGANMLMCSEKLWLRKCLSMPPTLKRHALWWWTEIRSKNSILNLKIDGSLPEIST